MADIWTYDSGKKSVVQKQISEKQSLSEQRHQINEKPPRFNIGSKVESHGALNKTSHRTVDYEETCSSERVTSHSHNSPQYAGEQSHRLNTNAQANERGVLQSNNEANSAHERNPIEFRKDNELQRTAQSSESVSGSVARNKLGIAQREIQPSRRRNTIKFRRKDLAVSTDPKDNRLKMGTRAETHGILKPDNVRAAERTGPGQNVGITGESNSQSRDNMKKGFRDKSRASNLDSTKDIDVDFNPVTGGIGGGAVYVATGVSSAVLADGNRLRFGPSIRSEKEMAKMFREVKNPKRGFFQRRMDSASNRLNQSANHYLKDAADANYGVNAVYNAKKAVDTGVGTVNTAKTMWAKHLFRKQEQADKKTVNALYKDRMKQLRAENPQFRSNPISRMKQKRQIKQEYVKARRDYQRAGQIAHAGNELQKKILNLKFGIEDIGRVISNAFSRVKMYLLACAGAVFIFLSLFNSCSTLAGAISGGSVIAATSYPASTEDILAAEAAYCALEKALQEQIDSLISNYTSNLHLDICKGTDLEHEYNIVADEIDEIGHDPYVLISAISAMMYGQEWTADSDEVQRAIQTLFDAQYDLEITETCDLAIGYHTVTKSVASGGHYESDGTYTTTLVDTVTTSSDAILTSSELLAIASKYGGNTYIATYTTNKTTYYTYYVYTIKVYSKTENQTWVVDYIDTQVDEDYTYCIYTLTVSLVNNDLSHVVSEQVLSSVQLEYYSIYQACCGNRMDLWPDAESCAVITAYINSEYYGYTVPSELLNDEVFAAILAEAEKYLGYPYVWGGSSPSTSFDCSGYVSYVLNHCGVGYSFDRTTAQGLFDMCKSSSNIALGGGTFTDESLAQPGDLVFFTKTYVTTKTVTHVGIYVGNGMMIHCGDPIHYSNINSSYWSQYFYAFGRLIPTEATD